VYGPCRSAIGGDHALTPPTRHSLGKPLPHQLADRTQADSKAKNLYSDTLARPETIENYLRFRVAMLNF
jgi:hypothetical protein